MSRTARLTVATLFAVPDVDDGVDVEALLAEAYARGREDAAVEAAARAAVGERLIEHTVAMLAAAQAVDAAALRGALVELVGRICRRVCRGELAVSAAVLERLVGAALAEFAANDTVRVYLHPDDLALLPMLPLPAVATPDASLRRGEVIVESPTRIVGDGLDDRLAELLSAAA